MPATDAGSEKEQPVQPTRIDPAILYFGTPVVLLSTVDEDGVTNTAPMSSVFWLGHTAVLGMGAAPKPHGTCWLLVSASSTFPRRRWCL